MLNLSPTDFSVFTGGSLSGKGVNIFSVIAYETVFLVFYDYFAYVFMVFYLLLICFVFSFYLNVWLYYGNSIVKIYKELFDSSKSHHGVPLML